MEKITLAKEVVEEKMTGLENKVLYVDMDGVLARWEDASYRDVSSEGFFLSRKPELNLIDAVRLIFELDMDVHILSSVLDNEYAIKEKKEWLRFWLPWLPECCCHFISYGSVKMPLCREKIAYLLDDYIRNLVHWSGVGIKFCTEYNDSRGSWDGHRIYATDTPPEMAKKILMIMKMDYKGGYGMLQMQSSEITLLERPNVEKNSKAPVIQLAPGFMIDDSILEKPTLLIGQVSSGKSYLLRNAIMPRIFSDMRAQDAAVIFATKRDD